ncbi:hypothetical protein VTK73DRAFT_5428 [Phialemonium thermophilum]|uniref:Transposase n=1 Tax=Phialemonium thermophilum TaxID=223376 RepID=A0ABR3V1S9_9PEZI
MSRLQAMQATWKKEYNTPGTKWDQLSVQWTDVEDQALRRAVKKARESIGFIGRLLAVGFIYQTEARPHAAQRRSLGAGRAQTQLINQNTLRVRELGVQALPKPSWGFATFSRRSLTSRAPSPTLPPSPAWPPPSLPLCAPTPTPRR